MQVIVSFLESFKSTFGVYWDFLLLLFGALIPGVVKVATTKFKRLLVRIRLKNLSDIEDLNVIRICSGTPNYDYNDIHTKVADKKLFIGFPKELRNKVLEHDEKFELHDDFSFDGSNTFEDITQKTEIGNFKELIDKHRMIVANEFVARTNGCLFNRPKFGVYKINYELRKGNDEVPEIRIDFFETDYFTHRVFRSIYHELKSQNHPVSQVNQENIKEYLNKYNSFTTSMGVNAFVITESKLGESIIFSKRSSNAAYSENKFKYNSTVMEGISQTDLDTYEKRVSLQLAVERALTEELGLSKDHQSKHDTKIEFCDFFLEKNYFEIGLTSIVRMDAVFEESISDLPGKDKELEISKLHPVKKSKATIEKFIKDVDIYPQGLFTLKMVCARDMIFINIKKKYINK
ncbi:hypothetical protein [Bacillus solimangrovi]|uniref:Nudix hydrolase domain-containing protein n=1 Tax=Bacillus solimangrovi TaxID=1305675 RepID=A0A1E5LEN5_9BACI|nr:hypothetical protein [Bacillus solimangrovi]OEH92534.1 hypothetical protein BFG57_15475 [Bacillus solimangrovi]